MALDGAADVNTVESRGLPILGLDALGEEVTVPVIDETVVETIVGWLDFTPDEDGVNDEKGTVVVDARIG